jgi:hypothetical protein
MSRIEAIRLLQKRKLWLERRVALAASHGMDFSFDRAEIGAIRLAIDAIAEVAERMKTEDSARDRSKLPPV